MDFLKKKTIWGEGAYPLKKVKLLPKIDFWKKKSVCRRRGLKTKKNKNPFQKWTF